MYFIGVVCSNSYLAYKYIQERGGHTFATYEEYLASLAVQLAPPLNIAEAGIGSPLVTHTNQHELESLKNHPGYKAARDTNPTAECKRHCKICNKLCSHYCKTCSHATDLHAVYPVHDPAQAKSDHKDCYRLHLQQANDTENT